MVDIEHALENLLFVADAPVTIEDLANCLEVEPAQVEEALTTLGARLEHHSGLSLIRIAGGYQLCTKPVYASYIAKLLQPQRQRLSKPALETLAIIAYKQPITIAEIEAIRGVNADGVMKTLLDRRLITEAGKKNAIGKPMMYKTTAEFLHQFGLNDISELPPLPMLEAGE